jgi:hypothetical protein
MSLTKRIFEDELMKWSEKEFVKLEAGLEAKKEGECLSE